MNSMDNGLEYAITTKDLCKVYHVGDGTDVIGSDHININIRKGKLTILKGRSGSGKTTLLNCLSALDAPTSGEIDFLGRKLNKLSLKEQDKLRRFKMGFVFQSVALVPVLTAYENVEFALRLVSDGKYHKDMEGNKERIKEVLVQVGLGERMDHMAGQLSGGEQQRVAIARAIVHRPEVLFADEPTGALDTATGLSVMKLFKELVKKDGMTVVMNTHDPNLFAMADDVYELKDGKLLN